MAFRDGDRANAPRSRPDRGVHLEADRRACGERGRAVGAAWRQIAGKLALKEIPLGELTFSDRTRQARSFELLSGQRLIVTWHQASNAPPNPLDVASLRAAAHSPLRTVTVTADSRSPVAVASRRPDPGRRRSGSPSGRYTLFWSEMGELIRKRNPEWRVGRPNRNDYPLFSPLPGSRVKCNFSPGGLRVELLLNARDRAACQTSLSAAWIPSRECCSLSTDQRRCARLSARCSARSRSKAVCGTRNAT